MSSQPNDPSDHPAPSTGIEIGPGVSVPQSGLRMQFARSSGPGGQNVNKINSKVELWVIVAQIVGLTDAAKERLRAMAGKRLTQNDELHLSAETSRSQEENRSIAMKRLRDLIIEAKKQPRIRRKTKPSRASKQRRLESKRRRSEIKSRRRGSEF